MATPGLILIAAGGRVSIGTDRLALEASPDGPAPTCCDCATQGGTLYAIACPCGSVYSGTEPPADCSAPDPNAPGGACIYVDLRSILNDNPTPLGLRVFDFWAPITTGGTTSFVYVGPTIKVGEFCYRFRRVVALFTEPETTLQQRAALVSSLTPPGRIDAGSVLDLPAGSTTAGGDAVRIPVVGGCGPEFGCSSPPLGGEFVEVFACDPRENVAGQRFFLCARLANGGEVFGCACVARGRLYSAADVAALSAANPGRVVVYYDEPEWDLVWVYGSGHPNRRPSTSCCFCRHGLQFGPPVCLVGQRWIQWGNDEQWAPIDVCCGREDGFGYSIAFSYTRTLRYAFGQLDVITASVDEIVRISQVTFEVRGTIRAKSYDASGALLSDNSSPFVIFMNPVCCLYPAFDHHTVPTIGYLTQNGPTFVDDWTGRAEPWYQLVYPNPDESGMVGEFANRLRYAWNSTPWATPFPVVSTAQGGTYTGSGACFGTCGSSNFILDESTNDGNGRIETVSINLAVTTIQDNRSPCGYIGSCGPSGWSTRDISDLLP